MMKPKIIPHPDLPDAKQLSILELNNVRFTGKRTVITPEKLEAAKPDCAEDTAAPKTTESATATGDASSAITEVKPS